MEYSGDGNDPWSVLLDVNGSDGNIGCFDGKLVLVLVWIVLVEIVLVWIVLVGI